MVKYRCFSLFINGSGSGLKSFYLLVIFVNERIITHGPYNAVVPW